MSNRSFHGSIARSDACGCNISLQTAFIEDDTDTILNLSFHDLQTGCPNSFSEPLVSFSIILSMVNIVLDLSPAPFSPIKLMMLPVAKTK